MISFPQIPLERESVSTPTVYQWLRLNFGDKPAPDIVSNTIKISAKASQIEFPEAAKELKERTLMTSVDPDHPQKKSSS